jgi:hypothetical protein
MSQKKFSFTKFFYALKWTFVAQITIGIFLYLIWILLGFDSAFPVGIYTMGIGGLTLTIAGCIGPGRYSRTYKLVLSSPLSGSSFSEEIAVSGFTMDEVNLQNAEIYVNDKKVGGLNFTNNVGRTVLSRDSVGEDRTINTIWLKSNDIISNKSYFTLFEYTENLSDEEIDEFYEMERLEFEKDISSLRKKYQTRHSRFTGSLTWGLLSSGLMIMVLGAIYESLFLT